MKENYADKGSAFSVEKCIVMWDNLDECANKIPEPSCETNNEHGKGEKPQAQSRHKSQDEEKYIENPTRGETKMITNKKNKHRILSSRCRCYQ
jgi:hypothetical protein